MHRIHVYRIHALHALSQHQGIQKPALFEIEPIDFVSGRAEEGVAGGVVVCQCAAEAGYARFVVQAALRVQFEGAVGLEV